MNKNKEKFTSGPWEVADNGEHELGPLIYSERVSGQPLALVYELKNHIADAHLIAAAPEMYDMLVEIEKYWTPTESNYSGQNFFDAIGRLQSVLKRAKGEGEK